MITRKRKARGHRCLFVIIHEYFNQAQVLRWDAERGNVKATRLNAGPLAGGLKFAMICAALNREKRALVERRTGCAHIVVLKRVWESKS